MICKPLYDMTKDCKSAPEVIKVLLDNGVITNSTLRELEIMYEYQESLRQTGLRFGAVLDVAVKKRVSKNTVYRARGKFQER